MLGPIASEFNANAKGDVWFTYGSYGYVNSTDSCLNNNTLREYFCYGPHKGWVDRICLGGCSSGACIKSIDNKLGVEEFYWNVINDGWGFTPPIIPTLIPSSSNRQGLYTDYKLNLTNFSGLSVSPLLLNVTNPGNFNFSVDYQGCIAASYFRLLNQSNSIKAGIYPPATRSVVVNLPVGRYKIEGYTLGQQSCIIDNLKVVRTCGNRVVDAGEQCDDGNNINGDGCNENCLIEVICNDSDGGLNYYVKGFAQDSYDKIPYSDYCTLNGLQVDNCIDKTKNCGLIERYCSTNNRRSGRYLYGSNFWSTCPNGCQDGACKTIPESEYTCPGAIYEGLCFANNNPPIFNRTTYENQNVKIWANDYPLRVDKGQNINFTLYLQNKQNAPFTFEFGYAIPADYTTIVSSDMFDSYLSKNESLVLNPLETVHFNSQFSAKRENFLGFNYHLVSIIDKITYEPATFPLIIEPNSNYTSCGGFKFPNQFDDLFPNDYLSWDYTSARCCKNVFYPSFECCSDSDCGSGRCVDGLCINRMFQGVSSVKDPAIGNKKVLMIISSNEANTDPNPCSNKIQNYQNLTNGVENYYDALAKEYINESSNFINFNWTIIGNFKIPDLGLDGEVTGIDIVNKSSQYCNINPYFYDEVVVYNPNQNSWCDGAHEACAGNPILIHSYEMISAGTLTHELAHNFGCRDLYTTLGGLFQWSTDLMTSREGQNGSFSGLQVCRGEMGWFDLNGNGIIEVKEFKHPTQIKINYTGIHDEERPKGRYIIFENLSVLGLDNDSKISLGVRLSIIIQREGNEEYICDGSETCVPVLATDIIILRAKYSYIDTSIGRMIELSDEIRLLVSDLSI